MLFSIIFLTSCVKLLLIPAYRSTDFEVHRNWLAITHSLPLKQWYFENTSEWTLDYPPLFAYFEYILSLIAPLFDKKMLVVKNLNYSSDRTVLFQRLSVILTDLIYTYGCYKCCQAIKKKWSTEVVLPILLITNCGLIMVDHIHFQYNGFMYGVLLLSIAYMMQGKHLASAFWFTILLNLKHIYMYIAPAYFVFLLRHYCMQGSLKNILSRKFIRNFTVLSSLVTAVFIVSFLPFHDHIGQVLSRMFPFKRGLCHAYWAPNIWALYNTVDKVLAVAGTELGYPVKNNTAAMTGGLVGEYSHSVLPNITPIITILLTGGLMLPALIKLWQINRQPTYNFMRCIVLCALTSFLFGWHVHEKAILMVIIPLCVLSVLDPFDARIFLLLGFVGHYSLFPLLFPDSLLIIKSLLLVLYSTYAFHSLSKIHTSKVTKCPFPIISAVESLYILGFALPFLYENVIHRFLSFNQKLPFLPLLLTSVYCSVGIVYCWVFYYVHFLRENIEVLQKSKKLL